MSVEPSEFFRDVATSFELSRTSDKGKRESAIVRISQPYFGGAEWRADVEIPPIRSRPFVVCGVDAKQALQLAERFVALLTEDDGWRRE